MGGGGWANIYGAPIGGGPPGGIPNGTGYNESVCACVCVCVCSN